MPNIQIRRFFPNLLIFFSILIGFNATYGNKHNKNYITQYNIKFVTHILTIYFPTSSLLPSIIQQKKSRNQALLKQKQRYIYSRKHFQFGNSTAGSLHLISQSIKHTMRVGFWTSGLSANISDKKRRWVITALSETKMFVWMQSTRCDPLCIEVEYSIGPVASPHRAQGENSWQNFLIQSDSKCIK